MTDTTNHAEVVREALTNLIVKAAGNVPSHAITGAERGLTALDALTREVDDLRADMGNTDADRQQGWGKVSDLKATIAAQSARIATLEEAALKAVEDEAEFPGDIPDDLYGLLRELAKNDDRGAITESLRIIVRLTKRGIAERLRAALAPSKGER